MRIVTVSSDKCLTSNAKSLRTSDETSTQPELLSIVVKSPKVCRLRPEIYLIDNMYGRLITGTCHPGPAYCSLNMTVVHMD